MEKETERMLREEIRELRYENAYLEKRMEAKRYKAIDKVVDTAYKVIHFGKDHRPKWSPKQLAERTVGRILKRKVDKGRIDIINVNFFGWDGETEFLGGAERYVYDLACLLKKMGYRPRILQGANLNFEKEYHGIQVVGVKAAKQEMNVVSHEMRAKCADAELVIASPLELASELDIDAPIIGINHGINFDHPLTTFRNTSGEAYRFLEAALRQVEHCVCVDTNFINWVRTKEYDLERKLDYIPNYYDPKVFKPAQKKSGKKLTFVYPRRIYAARGADITVTAFRNILKKHADKVNLRMIGVIDNDQIRKAVEGLIAEFPDNVIQTTYQPEEMHKAYEGADVVMIPTRYCEGTSLSCIEGMASGAAIIATTVGGLPNLVIDGYNGRLIAPTAESLEAAVLDIVEHPEKAKKMAANAVAVAKEGFTKAVWEKRWKEILGTVLEDTTGEAA